MMGGPSLILIIVHNIDSLAPPSCIQPTRILESILAPVL